MFAWALNFGNTKVFIIEALALQHGICMALKEGITDLLIEGDNLLVVNAVKGIWQPSWEIDYVIEDIRLHVKKFKSCDIKHIYREANKAADWMLM